MLEPDSRVVLLDQLRPPAGYVMENAVATSFTLDLATALIPPLAFASFQMRGATPDPVTALEAVRSCAERVTIFCQAGQIAVPAKASDLMAFLEKMVHPVTPPRRGFLFHPKLWFLQFSAPGQPDRFRLLCSTRNLVDSTAWDAAVTLEGVAGAEGLAPNEPLWHLLRALPEMAVSELPQDRLDQVLALAEQSRRIVWEAPENLEVAGFHTWGVPGHSADPSFTGYRHLVVSPFLNDAGLELLSPGKTPAFVVARPEELERLSPETVRTLMADGRPTTYVLESSAAVPLETSEGAAEEPRALGQPDVDRIGLHAKITVVERNRRSHVFIGSPNATSAAYGGNVEFAVELTGSGSKFGVDHFIGDGTPLRAFLVPYKAEGGKQPDAHEEAQHALENALRRLSAVPFTLTAHPRGEDFDVALSTAAAVPVPDGFDLRVALLTRPGVVLPIEGGSPAAGEFRGVELADITAFAVLLLRDESDNSLGTVVHCHLVNDPPSRLDEVLARQVDTPEKFLKFVALLLGLIDPEALMVPDTPGPGSVRWGSALGGSGVLELLVTSLGGRRDSLAQLQGLVDRLLSTEKGRAILPEGFEALWATVMQALERLPEDAA